MISGQPNVVIVGGSLGGLCAAIALRGIGCNVEIFERSAHRMNDRGAGIVMQFEMNRLLEEHGVCDRRAVSVALLRRRHLARDGSTIWEDANYQLLTSWDALYRALRRAFPGEHYHTASKLTHFEQNNDRVVAHFEGGRQAECDLLVCADGAGSTARGLLFPEVPARYAGYVAWRGLIEEAEISRELHRHFADQFTLFQGPHTHILCYLVPGPGGALTEGRRRFNWVWYWNAAEGEELEQLMTDRSGLVRDYSVPQGALRPETIARQAAIAKDVLPDVFLRLFEATREPFLQPIYDLSAPGMFSGRVCLIGDAAFVPRPHTAASSAKAAANSIALAKYLQRFNGDPAAALEHWDREQSLTGRFLNHVGICLGNRSQFGTGEDYKDSTYLQLVPGDALRLAHWIALDQDKPSSWRISDR